MNTYTCTQSFTYISAPHIPFGTLMKTFHTRFNILLIFQSIFKTEKCLNTDAVLLKLFTPQTNTQRIFIAVHVLRSFK